MMDITRHTFPNQLPYLIAAIADAHFVGIDLELSGIPGKQTNRPNPRGNYTDGLPSLQQRYEETKEAAERYQVLQLGITCVGENRDRGVYVVRPYNFFLNPVPDEKMNVERIFSYQSGGRFRTKTSLGVQLIGIAVNFLLNHGFRMEAPFLEGVPYFSRTEESIARQYAAQRQDKRQAGDMQARTYDAGTLELLQRLREEVVAWKNRTSSTPDFLNFAAVGYDPALHPERGLNSFQRRLVHEYIELEHPDLTTSTRPGFIQIMAYDQERENATQKHRKNMFEEKLAKQIGLRWLVEAICGGDLSAINPHGFYVTNKVRQEKVATDFINVRKQLEGKSTVLVGHNLFLDLIYFHACFFGPLPDRIEDFQKTIHDLFPRIIDTKYLATHNMDNPAVARSSLEELDDKLSNQVEPVIELHPEHSNYAIAKPAHEAGFDSYLTAKVLVRLSTILEKSGLHLAESSQTFNDGETYFTPPEGRSPERSPLKEDRGGVALTGSAIPARLSSSEESFTNSQAQSTYTPSSDRSPFSHATVFDLLGDIPPDEDLATLSLQPQKTDRPVSAKQAKRNRRVEAEKGKRMPGWENSFWETYGNKLRVNGTLEGVCDVGYWPYQDVE
ncbi:MAG: hypothetical protein Q9177_000871 [Variospora cf. flavescens]